MKTSDLKVGDKVHYSPAHYGKTKWENGLVKEIRDSNTEGVWVVYNCNGEWKKYKEYTGALTNLEDLKKGWRKV